MSLSTRSVSSIRQTPICPLFPPIRLIWYPFYIYLPPSGAHPTQPSEEFRSRYRYLDLRRSVLSQNIKQRSNVAHIIRNALHDQGSNLPHFPLRRSNSVLTTDFTEVETPALLRSSPEGAREFLVPARPSSSDPEPLVYALSQSPQQPKQMLICSGAVDRYFQIAKCFRDEDGRKDRQPEFTQVDLEMAFVSWGETPESADPHAPPPAWRIGGREVRDVAEDLVRRIWRAVKGIELPDAFPVMSYNDAMTRVCALAAFPHSLAHSSHPVRI